MQQKDTMVELHNGVKINGRALASIYGGYLVHCTPEDLADLFEKSVNDDAYEYDENKRTLILACVRVQNGQGILLHPYTAKPMSEHAKKTMQREAEPFKQEQEAQEQIKQPGWKSLFTCCFR